MTLNSHVAKQPEQIPCSENPLQEAMDMTTSKKVASQAGKDLRNPKTPKQDRGPIASDLAQAKNNNKKKK
jgi:hypothetical protein